MKLWQSKAIVGVLAGFALLPAAITRAQTQIRITVEDASGAALTGAVITGSNGKPLGQTDESGQATIECAIPCSVRISANGFAPRVETLTAAERVRLEPANIAEQVTVTAYRTPLGDLESPATTRALTQTALATTAAITLDDELRQLPGVELFRRSSSLVANPSSQGISLRGLGSTSASRTLVTEDDVPLNDPLGGWIHWQETPELAIGSVELLRGGASDLYGSSAIGGVVNLIPALPSSKELEVRSTYGGEETYDQSALATAKRGPWGGLIASGLIGTDGFIQEAPNQRGPVDQPSNVHSQNALLIGDRASGDLRLFARASGFNELRHNGTPYQFNGTRLVRYATGADWANGQGDALKLRLYGSDERYRQTFSSISNLPDFGDAACTYRCGETPTKYSYVPDNELGAALNWTQTLTSKLLLVAGADVRDVRVWDEEQSFGAKAAITNLHDHQRDSAGFVEALWTRNAWTVTASGRVDWFQNFDGRQLTWNGTGWTPSATQPPQNGERLFDPRLGVSRKLAERWAVSASGFRAFRAPTPNELYRATQVGNELTLANGNLKSERATGWEAGLATHQPWGTIRTSYFLTEVNRPITALTTNPNSSPILLKRENLGQIESRGVSLDYDLAPLHWLSVDGGYQYAHATVSRGAEDYGKWIPEVARNLATLNVRASEARLGTLSLQSRLSGRMYDDDANAFLLHGYFRLDAYASHSFGNRLEVFAAGENLFDRSIQVSETPTTTLGQPRVARAGFQVMLGSEGK
ncbi:MAG: TonB-dependent receptor [Terracidiphilus sp.]|jgi:outer membrane receptor protein involved in Fe transport